MSIKVNGSDGYLKSPLSLNFGDSLQKAVASLTLEQAADTKSAIGSIATASAPLSRTEDEGQVTFPDYKNEENLVDERRYEEVLKLTISRIEKDPAKLNAIKKADYDFKGKQEEMLKAEIHVARIQYELESRFEEKDKRLPLWKAIASTDLKAADKLAAIKKALKDISAKDLNSSDKLEKNTFLEALALGGDNGIATLLMQKGLDLSACMKSINAKDFIPGSNLLHLAAKENNNKLVAFLLEQICNKKIKLNVNTYTTYGDTALTLAIKNRALKTIEALTNDGFWSKIKPADKMERIDLDLGKLPPVLLAVAVDAALRPVIDFYRDYALEMAEWYAQETGTPVQDPRDFYNKIRETVFTPELDKKWEEYVNKDEEDNKLILTKSYSDFRTLSMHMPTYDLLALLFESNLSFDASKIDENYRNLYFYTVPYGDGCIADMIKNATASNKKNISKPEINAHDLAGWTPLAYAAKSLDAILIATLIDAGADANLPTKNNKTPLKILIEERLDHTFRKNPEYIADPEKFVQRVQDANTEPFIQSGVDTFLNQPGADFSTTVTDLNGDPISLMELAIRYGDEGLYSMLVEKGVLPSEDERMRMEDMRNKRDERNAIKAEKASSSDK